MKVIEEIIFEGYTIGSGFSYEENYEVNEINVYSEDFSDIIKELDCYDWESLGLYAESLPEREDTLITINYYFIDEWEKEDSKPFHTIQNWQSDIR